MGEKNRQNTECERRSSAARPLPGRPRPRSLRPAGKMPPRAARGAGGGGGGVGGRTRLSARRRLRHTPREGTRATSLLGRTRSHPPSPPPFSPLCTHRTQIHTHRPERRGRTPRPPPPPPPAEEVQPLPPAAMTPHLARSGGPPACDSSGSLRPHLHLTPRTRPSARQPARRACTWGRGRAPLTRVGEGRRGEGRAPPGAEDGAARRPSRFPPHPPARSGSALGSARRAAATPAKCQHGGASLHHQGSREEGSTARSPAREPAREGARGEGPARAAARARGARPEVARPHSGGWGRGDARAKEGGRAEQQCLPRLPPTSGAAGGGAARGPAAAGGGAHRHSGGACGARSPVPAESRASQRSIAAAYTPSPSSAARPAQPPPRPRARPAASPGAAHAPAAWASRLPPGAARGQGRSHLAVAPAWPGRRPGGTPARCARPAGLRSPRSLAVAAAAERGAFLRPELAPPPRAAAAPSSRPPLPLPSLPGLFVSQTGPIYRVQPACGQAPTVASFE